MKVRDSEMPGEHYWESLFDVPLILERMGVDSGIRDAVELGCGYGTFSIPVARCISGTLHTFDIDEDMVRRTRLRAGEQGASNVVCTVRDVIADGYGLPVGAFDEVLLFNILHYENPADLLRSAAELLRPGGAVLAIHWRRDPATPRGPALEMRPQEEDMTTWADETGLLRPPERTLDLPPWHQGWRLVRKTP